MNAKKAASKGTKAPPSASKKESLNKTAQRFEQANATYARRWQEAGEPVNRSLVGAYQTYWDRLQSAQTQAMKRSQEAAASYSEALMESWAESEAPEGQSERYADYARQLEEIWGDLERDARSAYDTYLADATAATDDASARAREMYAEYLSALKEAWAGVDEKAVAAAAAGQPTT